MLGCQWFPLVAGNQLIGIQLDFSSGRVEARFGWEVALLLLHKDLVVTLAVAEAVHALVHGSWDDGEAAAALLEDLPFRQLDLLLLFLGRMNGAVLDDAEELQALAHQVDHQQDDQVGGKQMFARR